MDESPEDIAALDLSVEDLRKVESGFRRFEIEFVQGFVDAVGNAVTPAELGLPPTIPDEVRHVVTFTSIGDATTELTVHEFGYRDEQTVEVSRAGMEQVLDKLAAALAGG